MLKRIRPTTWEEVFQDWKQREGNDPGWIHCATVLKGWDSWESWRRFTAEQIGAPTRGWAIYEFTDPMMEIPQMLVGPFTGWQSKLPAPNRHTFVELVGIPEQAAYFRAHEKVISMSRSFPPSTIFVGLQFAGSEETIMSDRTQLFQSGKVICIEGHHRATVVALAVLDGKQIDFGGPVHVALATLKADETHLLDDVLARGNSK